MRPLRPRGRITLFVAFAFTVMADPVSSVAYAIEAALGALDGDLAGLVPTMALVVGTIALVAATYTQLIRRFPGGGGGAEALAEAFGEGWAFLPLGALVVDFTLTIAVSCAAASSAVVAWSPDLAPTRTALAIVLAIVVAGVCLLGHRGRIAFATAALAFLVVSAVVLLRGALHPGSTGAPALVGDAGATGLGALLLAMPLGMALATGVEAPSNAIAQLEQLDDDGRAAFGRWTIWLMVLLVGLLTLGFAALAVHLGVTGPRPDSTLLADVARIATGDDVAFDVFQAVSALLLLAAAASSFIAGSGVLKALASHGAAGLLPRRFSTTNRFFAPPAGIAVLLVLTIVLLVAAGGRDTVLVQFYAAAVFASFLGALVAAAVLHARERRWAALTVNVLGVVPVLFVLVLNLRRGDPLAAIGAALLIAGLLHRRWVRAGRPGGVARVVVDA